MGPTSGVSYQNPVTDALPPRERLHKTLPQMLRDCGCAAWLWGTISNPLSPVGKKDSVEAWEGSFLTCLCSPLTTATPEAWLSRQRLPWARPGEQINKQARGWGRQVQALAPLSPWLGSRGGVREQPGLCLGFLK